MFAKHFFDIFAGLHKDPKFQRWLRKCGQQKHIILLLKLCHPS